MPQVLCPTISERPPLGEFSIKSVFPTSHIPVFGKYNEDFDLSAEWVSEPQELINKIYLGKEESPPRICSFSTVLRVRCSLIMTAFEEVFAEWWIAYVHHAYFYEHVDYKYF